MNVKKLLAFTTAIAAALCLGSNITAFADGGLTIPEDFSVELTLESVTDYAADENTFAFASGAKVYVYSSSTVSGGAYTDGALTTYTHSSSVLGLEYGGGVLYFYDSSNVYEYSEGSATKAEFTFTEYSDSETVTGGDYLYYIRDNALSVVDTANSSIETKTDGVYKSIKKIDGVIYILRDSALCTIADGVITALSFSYDDYDAVTEIATGGTADALKQADTVQTAAIAQGACLIRVDDSFDGDYFTTSDVTFAEGSESAQVLYNPSGGNAALIAIGSKTYLTLKSSLTISGYTLAASTTAYAYFLDGAGIYSLPFASESTRVATAETEDVVKVLGIVSGSAFDYTYYKVEYTSNGDTVTGYALSSLLTPYTFSDVNSGAGLIEDEPSTENNITTIILIMVIVALVLIAAGYITYVATSKPTKKTGKK